MRDEQENITKRYSQSQKLSSTPLFALPFEIRPPGKKWGVFTITIEKIVKNASYLWGYFLITRPGS